MANRDLLAVQSIVLLLVLAVVVINFLVDVAYTSIDPRPSEGLMSTTSLTARPEPGTAPEASVRERRARRERRPLEPGLVIGGSLILLVALTAVVSLIWTPTTRPWPWHPTPAAALGRALDGHDRYGRDVLSQVMAGSADHDARRHDRRRHRSCDRRALGILAACGRKRAGVLVMGGSDVLMAFPGLLLAIVFGAVFGGAPSPR